MACFYVLTEILLSTVHCGGYLRDQRGTITFPDEGFDRIINEAIDCMWTFEAELSNKIEYQIHNYLIDRDGSWKCEFAYIKVQYNLNNSNSDFSKYLFIQIKFWTQWIQRIGPIYELF